VEGKTFEVNEGGKFPTRAEADGLWLVMQSGPKEEKNRKAMPFIDSIKKGGGQSDFREKGKDPQ